MPTVFDRNVRLPLSLASGVLLTLVLWRLGALAAASGHHALAAALYWQDTLIHGYALAHQGQPDDPMPFVARLASLPAGFLVYAAASYAVLWAVARRS